jgi:acetylornithine deacetylase/succinyl-diaminopimelate desuccinylase-like protein
VAAVQAAILAFAVTVPPLAAQTGPDVARSYREAHEPALLRDFARLLALPNVASDAENIARNATWIRDRLEEVGVDAELLQLRDAPPLVYGTLTVPGATRTLGIYVHYDGQPANPEEWTHPPFEPTLYSRSMEEAGSPHLQEYLETYRDRFDPVDVWLFFDGPAHQSGRPQLTFGVRGSMGMEVTVYGATRGLHSGHYGNWAPDTPMVLADLLRSMKDPYTGEVLIEGWYDTVEPLGDEERAALAALPDYDEELKRELGLAWTEGAPASLAERLLRPALTVRGLTSANTGRLASNVIPAEAVASLGIRLVKGNDPAHLRGLVEEHIRRQGFHVVRQDPDLETRLRHPRIAKVTGGGGYPAARTSMADPYVREVIAAGRAAADRAFGEGSLVLTPGLGGSLPLYLFTDLMGKPFVNVPVANHDNNQHAPDENLRVGNLWYAIDLYAALLTMPRRGVP